MTSAADERAIAWQAQRARQVERLAASKAAYEPEALLWEAQSDAGQRAVFGVVKKRELHCWRRAGEFADALARDPRANAKTIEAAGRLRNCHDPEAGVVRVCEKDAEHYHKFSHQRCMNRFCPRCAQVESLRLQSLYLKKFLKAMKYAHVQSIQMWTFTMPATGNYAADFALLGRGTRAAVRCILGDDKRAGLIIADEPGPRGGNVHSHALGVRAYRKQKEVQAVFEKAVGWDHEVKGYHLQVRANEVRLEDGLGEVLKYATKLIGRHGDDGDSVLPTSALVDLYFAFKKHRRVRTWGTLKRLQVKESQAAPVTTCPVCGGRLVDTLSVGWLRWLLSSKVTGKESGNGGANGRERGPPGSAAWSDDSPS